MPNLPTAAVLAVLVLASGIAGVVAADPTATPVATTTATENDTPTDATVAPEPMPPAGDGTFEERLAARLAQFDLTDGQVRAIVGEASRLHDDGASRLVIKSSVVLHLYEFGVDAPFLYADGDDATSPADRIAAQLGERFDLTDAQVAEIASTIERMHADGASRTEIYRAVHALLVDYGVDEDELDDLRQRVLHAKAHQLHERAHAMHQRADRLHHAAEHDRPTDVADRPAPGDVVDRLDDRYDLTDEEAETLDRLLDGMIDDGASREEIRDAVIDQLRDWGYDVPTDDRPAGDADGR